MRALVLSCLLFSSSVVLAESKPSSLAAQVPPTAIGVLLIEKDATDLLRRGVETRPGLRTELGEYLQRQIGFDLFAITGVAAWVEGFAPLRLSIYLRGPRLVGKSDIAPAQASNAQGGVLITGPHSGPPTTPSTAPSGALAKLMADSANADVLLALTDFSIDPSFAQLAQQFGIDSGRLVLTKAAVRAEVTGDPQKLEMIGKMIVQGISMAGEKLAQERERALARAEVTAEGAAAIYTFHQFVGLRDELQPRIAGNRMTLEYKLPDMSKMNATLPVAMIGVLSAVAIPAFTKYVRRSKAVEARINLPRAASGVRALVEPSPQKLAKLRFPPSTGWTPATPCAKEPNQKCQGFQGGSWEKLGFAIAEPHYFQYRLTTSGVGKKATYKLEAQADLDGDGVFSTYTIEGAIGPDGSVIEQPIAVVNEGE